MLRISNTVSIAEDELEITAIRSQGPGGQHVNKVSTAIQLRFDFENSSLPEFYKQRLREMSDHHISRAGVIVIKSQGSRSQEKNREEAYERLRQLLLRAVKTDKLRRATRPTRSSQQRRMDSKARRGKQKVLRGRVDY